MSSRERQLEKPASGAAAAKGKSKGKGNSGDCVEWTTKGQCSRGDTCGMNHDPEKRQEWVLSEMKHTQIPQLQGMLEQKIYRSLKV